MHTRTLFPLKSLLMALLLATGFRGAAQISLTKDKAAQASVAQALDYAYNYQFAKADSIVRQLPAAYANHPALSLLQALNLQWRYMPVDKNPDASKAYRIALEKASSQSEAWLEKSPGEPEATFFAMMGNLLLCRLYANQDETMKAVNATRKGYSYLKDGKKLMDRYPEFYFSTGLYSYYRMRYPEDHPVYNAFLIFFPSGDKGTGIEYLHKATDKGLFTRYEADFFLTYIYLHNENKPVRAYESAERLVQKYPQNPLYRILFTEACLSLGHYGQAQNQLRMLDQGVMNPFYRGIMASLEGWLAEKHYKNPDQAAEHYRRSLELTKPYANTSSNFRAIAYAGLARLSAGQSKPQQARQYYRHVESLARNTVLKEEARKYLAKS